MAHLIYFSTNKFDPSKETPNPINPIPGQSVLLWIREQLLGKQYTATEPDTEDWGWYTDVSGNGVRYMIGASGEPNQSSGLVDWILQVHKHRTLRQKLTGKNKLEPNDEFVELLTNLIRSDPTMRNVSSEAE